MIFSLAKYKCVCEKNNIAIGVILTAHRATRCGIFFFVQKMCVDFHGEGRKSGFFMNPRVIPTCIAFWPGEKEWNQYRKDSTLEHYCNR